MLFFAVPIHAQWQRVTATPLFRSPSSFAGGAMTYKQGIVWAGASDVWKSQDLGLTWARTSCPSGRVYNISFFDDSVGVVCMVDLGGLYLTTDQGTRWTNILRSTNVDDAAFGVTADTIVVTTYQGVQRTTDQGKTWSFSSASSEREPISSRDGIFYYKDNSRIFLSSDAGLTWGPQTGVADYDCHSWAFDSCDAGTIYLVNEALYWPTDSIAAMYVTHDLGATWQAVNSHRVNAATHTGYYCGNAASSRTAIYTQTNAGIIRSINKGQTWQNIGGPAGQPDQRLIAIAGDTVLLVADEDGKMWRKTDGIGTPYYGAPTLLTPTPLFANQALPECEGPFTRGFVIGHTCMGPHIVGWRIAGLNAALYSIKSLVYDSTSALDTFAVQFSPTGPGYYVDTVLLTYDDSTHIIVPLRSQVLTAPSPALLGDGHPLFQGARLDSCSVPLDSTIVIAYFCPQDSLRSVRILGLDSKDYQILSMVRDTERFLDSITLRFRQGAVRLNAASLEILYGDGTNITLALAGRTIQSPPIELLAPRDSLFSGTTLTPCDKPVSDTIIILAVCDRIMRSIQVAGRDSANYHILSINHNFSAELDTIVVGFTVAQPGGSAGKLVVEYDDSTIAIPLAGLGIPGPLPHALNPVTLFSTARVSYCDAPLDTFVVIDEGCRGRAVKSRMIEGVDSANYKICCFGRDSIRLYDTIRLSFWDSTIGPSHALLTVRYDDGASVQVPLGGSAIQLSPPVLASSRSTLFSTAKMYPCEEPVPDSCWVHVSCNKQQLASVKIIGKDTSNYRISGVIRDSLHGLDSVRLIFLPDSAGPSNASLVFTYADGASVTVALAGEGREVAPASVSLSDITDDTIGGTVYIPITIHHGPPLAALAFDLHFDTAQLAFLGLQMAKPGSPPPTFTLRSATDLRVTVDFTSDETDLVTVLYALFDWYPADSGGARVMLDTITTTATIPGCIVESNQQTDARLSGAVSCWSPFLVSQLRRGVMPDLFIRPNPASHLIELASNAPIDAIRISDALGRDVLRMAGSARTIDVSQFPAGLYYVQAQHGAWQTGRTLIIER
ncbi:MAG: T9SS type A sorting domain-containing protein [Bacteroidota bacterium]|nr:T9SS type A sorting domain-containing protein [Bacteroidota bacterium]MDP4234179.1 T9SS type A sorting domain-containing protein [Bacteroidota bacterium]MDP4243755.1 T9SS type A sorting domain-containing protein [Bacteroidota bacterium]MDP4287880.1 T9SS type A sorting domain-containing protein [Bacteroidota bacterium]